MCITEWLVCFQAAS